jgi:putative ABC transport system permease protein
VSLWRQLQRGVADLWDRSTRDRDVADEVAHFRAALIDDGLARGLSLHEAERAAQLELGGVTQLRETVRGYGWERAVAAFAADLRYAWRGLRNDRTFSLVAAFTIAVGVGGATAIYSAVRPVLFDALPYPHAARVRAVLEHTPDGARSPSTYGMYRALDDAVVAFDAFAVHASWAPTLTGGERPERLVGQRVTADYFRVLGVAPAMGRAFTAEDDRAGSAESVIISDRLWRQRFAADPTIVGGAITLDHATATVIGVMPADFEHVVSPDVAVWTTLKYDLGQGRAWGHHLAMLGRLRAGVDPAVAEVELNTIGARVISEQRPPTYGSAVRWSAPSLHEELTRDVRPALVAILIAVGVVLLLACANVTNLLLVRGARRREEFALRAALGASRGRLVRQVLTESLLLSTVGGVLGVVGARLGVSALVAASPAGLPRVQAIAVDRPVLVFSVALTMLAGLVVGLIPAWQASGHDRLAIDLGSARLTGGSRTRLRNGLVAAQVALALVLLTGSGLLLRSMHQLFSVSPGFDARAVVTMQLPAAERRFVEPGAMRRHFDAILDAVRGAPGVTEAALTSQLPMSGDRDAYGVHLEVPPETAPAEEREIFRYAVSPGYLEVMRIPIRAGRTLTVADHAEAPWSVVVNESFARRYLPGRDPIGQRLRIGPTDGPAYTVVGVAGDVKQLSLAGDVPDAVYTTAAQWRFEENVMSLVVRGTMDPDAMVPAVRSAIWAVDADQPVVRVASMASLLDETAADRRFILLLFELFGLAALVLTTAGIYGMMSGLVNERRRELGLRAAVGATATQLVALVYRHGVRVTAIGMLFGLVGALIGTRMLVSMLYGVSHLDPITYAGTMLALGVVASVACAGPAWRAARLDPCTALRS